MTIIYQLYHHPSDSAELKQHAPELKKMIDTAFEKQDRSSFDKDPFARADFEMPGSITEGWGSDGILVVAYDNNVSELPRGLPVGTAGAKLWSGRAITLYQAFKAGTLDTISQPDPSNWELCVVTSKYDMKYRGQGIASQCMAMVENHVKTQLGGSKMWLSAVAGVGNIEFYGKKGYTLEGKLDDAPAGMWTANYPFQIGTMVKTL